MLETGRVGGIAGDRDIHPFEMVNGHALPDIVGPEAADLRAFTAGVGGLGDHMQFAGGVVEPGLDIGEAVDPRNDLGGILAQAVEDDPERRLPHPVGRAGDADRPFGGGERFVAGQEGEALGLFLQQPGGQVAVAEADLAVVGDRTGDAEGLQALA